MSRTVYLNGTYVPEAQARISVFDRGFLFADAVYEVCAVLRGKLLDNAAHLSRLRRSLRAVDITFPPSDAEITRIERTLIERNRLDEGLVYLQITRGVADRAFACPPDVEPSVVLFTQARAVLDSPAAERGLSVVTVPDIRWRRRDIKTTGLLASVLAMHAARQADADDAWLVEEGLVTEGSNNNAYIITDASTLVTRAVSNDILSGITRAAVLQLCGESGLAFEERAFSLAEARAASEAFITSATSFVMPVVRVDGRKVGDGRPGPHTVRLRALYIQRALESLT